MALNHFRSSKRCNISKSNFVIMVHHRINEKQSNPNPHINFITPLRAINEAEEESARELLRALAAQVRPVMKSQGFEVNSFEEYEHNAVFAGRNWNAGETIELVLRRPDGRFLPNSWLMSTLCHELAHIKHMHHGPAFHVLWRQLRADVRQLQDRGYYGDGYWSSGTRLADSAHVSGDASLQTGDFPEYICGGAHTRHRPVRKRKRRAVAPAGPSNRTGRQTEKRRKPGARVRADVFAGAGVALNEGDTTGAGTSFRKQASSNRAREERALAVERRLRAMQGIKPEPALNLDELIAFSDDDEDEKETDEQRRQTLLDSFSTKEESEDIKMKKEDWLKFEDDFDFMGACKPEPGIKKEDRLKFEDEDNKNVLDLSDSDGCDMPIASGSTFVSGTKRKAETDSWPRKMTSRKKQLTTIKKAPEEAWNCLVCTLLNESQHLACSACSTPRGEDHYSA